jgi:hypothetical protein
MKPAFLIFLLFAQFSLLSGQSDKVYISLEYSPNFTSATKEWGAPRDVTFRFTNNVFVKAGYKIENNLFANAGIGFLTTKEFASVDYQGLEYSVDQIRLHSYVIAPIGLTYYIGSFYVNPEIGIGWNVANKMKDTFYYQDGSIIKNKWVDKNNIYDVNEVTYPIFLTIGNEVRFNSWSILLGIKGYYSLNSIGERASNSGHYYGFGVLTGVKF